MSKARVFHYLLDTLPRLRPIRSARLLNEDAILVKMELDEVIAIYYVDQNLSIPAIKKAFNTNTQRDIHTLFILSQAILPLNGATAAPSDALALLLEIYNGKVYAARTLGQVSIFPVYVDALYRVTYGAPVDLNDLSGDYALIESGHMQGIRHIADFERSYYHPESFSGASVATMQRHPLQQFYDVLGITSDAPEDAIKKAYREKAHQNHPDRDPSPDATKRMQRINEAYDEIMKQWR